MDKSADAFRTIGEVAEELDVPKHVLRFWEGKFPQVKPMKRGGGRRYYRPDDVVLLKGIRRLLYDDGYTIKGVQKVIRENGLDFVKQTAREAGDRPPQVVAAEPVHAPEPVSEPAPEPRAPNRSTAPEDAPVVEKPAPRRRVSPPVSEPVLAVAPPSRAAAEPVASGLSQEQVRRLRQARRELEICLHLLATDDPDDDDNGEHDD